jgi:hypothetical protein
MYQKGKKKKNNRNFFYSFIFFVQNLNANFFFLKKENVTKIFYCKISIENFTIENTLQNKDFFFFDKTNENLK